MLAHCAADVDLVRGCGQQVLIQDAKERAEPLIWVVCGCLHKRNSTGSSFNIRE